MKNIFQKFLTNKNSRSKITIGNQNEFSGVIANPVSIESTVENLQNVNVSNLNYTTEVVYVNTSLKSLEKVNSGATVVLNRANGSVIVLPTPEIGLTFEFYILTSVTSNDYTIVTQNATLIGNMVNVDTDTDNAVDAFLANGTTHVAINMNGTTSGGIKGTYFKLTCISSDTWLVNGTNIGTGIVESPFITE